MKKIIGMSLIIILLGFGVYYYAWFQAATILKEEWVTLADRLNAQSKGLVRIQYDTIQTSGFPLPKIKILLKNLSLESTQSNDTSAPFLLALGDVHGLIRLNDKRVTFTLEKTLKLTYKDALSQQPLTMESIYQKAPHFTVTRSESNVVFLKKFLSGERMHDWLDRASIESFSFVFPASHNTLSVNGKSFITDKSQGLKFRLTQKKTNNKDAIELVWSIANYELSSEYFDYLIENSTVPQKRELLTLLKDFNAKLGPISLHQDMAFLGDLNNLQEIWTKDALDINTLSIQSRLGGIDVALHIMPGDICGYIKLSRYETLIPELISQYNTVVTSEYGKMTAVSTGAPATSIEQPYAESILALLKQYGKPMDADLRFDYERLPTGDMDINGKSGTQFFVELMTIIETIKAKQLHKANEAPEESTQSDKSSDQKSAQQEKIESPVAPAAASEEAVPDPAEQALSLEKEKLESAKKIEALEDAKQKTLENIEALKQ